MSIGPAFGKECLSPASRKVSFKDFYLEVMEKTRTGLSQNDSAVVEKGLSSLPQDFHIFYYCSGSRLRYEEARELVKGLMGFLCLPPRFVAKYREGRRSLYFLDPFLTWLGSVFPKLDSIVQSLPGETAEDDFFQIPFIFLENAVQHWRESESQQGACLCVFGTNQQEAYFTVLTASDFELGEAVVPGGKRGAQGGWGKALSTIIPSILDDGSLLEALEEKHGVQYELDVLLSSRDQGLIYDKGKRNWKKIPAAGGRGSASTLIVKMKPVRPERVRHDRSHSSA